MDSLIYTSAIDDMLHRRIDFDADEFRVMLVGDRYRPDGERHRRRSDVSDEISGEGYAAGGLRVDVSIVKNPSERSIDVLLGAALWPNSSLQASGAVYFRSRGRNPANDELIAFVDFGGDVISTHGNWALTPSTLRFQMSRNQAA
jgi:hypothetical protein